jgi:simple sugar transport system permease protein
MGELFQEAVVVSILAATVRIMTPLLFAAIGELVTQRAGIWNMGVEGTMLMGRSLAPWPPPCWPAPSWGCSSLS